LQPAKSVEAVMEEIISEEFGPDQRIRSVTIVSKSGLMIAGQPASVARAETFSAMTAIMFSAAETTKKEIVNEDLERLVIFFKKTMVLVSELSANLLIVVVADRDADQESLLGKMGEVISRSKAELSWLR
jgi:predicted regulator of Ras-like GTPase activity (Roadblock/LC7/MglB family)